MIRHLEVMAEYDASPLWDRTPGSVSSGPVELDSLPLSRHLVEALTAWSDEYSATGSTNFRFQDPRREEKWARHGQTLANMVQQELGAGYEVRYRR